MAAGGSIAKGGVVRGSLTKMVLSLDAKRRSTRTRAMVEKLRSKTRHSRECGNPSSLCNTSWRPGGAQAPALRQDPMRRNAGTRAMVEELRSLTRHSRIRGNPSSLCNASRKPVEGQAPVLRGVDKTRSSANQKTLAESNCLAQAPLAEVKQ